MKLESTKTCRPRDPAVTTEIPVEEREFIREELSFIAGRLMKNCPGLSIPECRKVIQEILDVSI